MIKIDEQFKSIIPPLTDDELARLKESILKEGVRDRLVLWNDTIIDGHNRYKIATENDIPFETTSMEFESREHALNWMIANQLGRRNLNPNQIAYLRGKRYETEKKIWGGDRHSEEFKSSSLPNANLKDKTKTSEVLGSEYGVHKSTIIRNANFAKVVDILPEEVKHDVLSGEEKISRTMTDTILDFDKPTQKKFIKEVEQGTPIKEAIKKVDPEQKRKEKDDELRARMKRESELRKRAKFTINSMFVHNGITVCSKEEFIENEKQISNAIEVWVLSEDVASDLKIKLREKFNIKFNQ